jgi:hypothetical protein
MHKSVPITLCIPEYLMKNVPVKPYARCIFDEKCSGEKCSGKTKKYI